MLSYIPDLHAKVVSGEDVVVVRRCERSSGHCRNDAREEMLFGRVLLHLVRRAVFGEVRGNAQIAHLKVAIRGGE